MTTEELITEAAEAANVMAADHPARGILFRLVAALEATVKEMHARELHHFEEEQNRAEAEAKIERAEDFVTRHYLDTQVGARVLAILSGGES